MPRRIKSAKIKFISLVPKGANNLPTLYKADDGTLTLNTLTKASSDFDEKGELLSVVYTPEQEDLQGDIASAEVIREMAHSFAKEGMSLDIRHDGEKLSRDQAYVAETFIVQKGDPRFADFKDGDNKSIDVTGAWAALIKIDDADLRKAYREGKWQGVSMAGPAVVESTKSDEEVGLLVRMFRSILKNNDGDTDMKPEEMKAILAENNKALIEGISKGIGDALQGKKPEETTQQTKQKQAEFDPENLTAEALTSENIAKHRALLAKQQIIDNTDWSDDESVAEAEKALAEIEKSIPKGKVHRKAPSNAGGDANLGKGADSADPTALSKEAQDAAAEMAKYLNQRRGTVPAAATT